MYSGKPRTGLLRGVRAGPCNSQSCPPSSRAAAGGVVCCAIPRMGDLVWLAPSCKVQERSRALQWAGCSSMPVSFRLLFGIQVACCCAKLLWMEVPVSRACALSWDFAAILSPEGRRCLIQYGVLHEIAHGSDLHLFPISQLCAKRSCF